MKRTQRLIGLFVVVALTVCFLSACGENQPTPTVPMPTSTDRPTTDGPFESPIEPPASGGQGLEGLLAFHSERSGMLQIYLLGGDTGEAIRLTNDPAGAFEPDWSPDCRSLVFASRRDDPNAFELYTISADGSGERRLFRNEGADDWAPAWSPTGEIIAYQTNQTGLLNICFLDTSGESLGCLEGEYNKASPAWSPDGSKVLFISDRDGDWDIYVADYPAASEPQPLTNNAASDVNPRFSPDGTSIAFASDPLGNYEIFTMDVDGTNLVQLTDDGLDDVTPRWIGNDRLVFASQRTGDFELYVMNRDGSNVQQLTDSPELDKWPVWCPGE